MEKDTVWLSVVGRTDDRNRLLVDSLQVIRVSTTDETWGGYRNFEVGMYVECEYDRDQSLLVKRISHWNGPISVYESGRVDMNLSDLFRQIEKKGLGEVHKYYGTDRASEDDIPF